MNAAAGKEFLKADEGIDLSQQSLKGARLDNQVETTLTGAKFSSQQDYRRSVTPTESVEGAFSKIFGNEQVQKMWLSSGEGAHVTLSTAPDGGDIIRVIDTRQQGKGVTTILHIDDKARIAVSPSGDEFALATSNPAMVVEYKIKAGGTLEARPVYQASEGKIISDIRYNAEGGVVIKERSLFAVQKKEREETTSPSSALTVAA